MGCSTMQCNSADKLLLHEREDSKLRTSLQISVYELQNFLVFLWHSSVRAPTLLVFRDTGSQCVFARLLEYFQDKLLTVYLVQVDFQKT